MTSKYYDTEHGTVYLVDKADVYVYIRPADHDDAHQHAHNGRIWNSVFKEKLDEGELRPLEEANA